MRVDKVILKAVFSTLAAVFLLCALLFSTMCLVFPNTMMKVSYDLGMDGASIGFASTAYDRSGTVYYIAYATEVSIEAGNDGKTVACGKRLVADEEFASYATARDTLIQQEEGAYAQYIYGKICVAEYRLGEKTLALTDAQAYLPAGFPASNPLVALVLEAIKANDESTVCQSLAVLRGILEAQSSALSSADGKRLGELIDATENWLNG